jgi:hypothetical protein
MFYAVVQLYSNATIKKFDSEEDAVSYLATCSEKGVSFGLGYIDTDINEIRLSVKYESLPEGPGKQVVKDIILDAYKIHQLDIKKQ